METKSKYFYPLEDKVNELILSHISFEKKMRCIDLGCGKSKLYEELLKNECIVYRIDKEKAVFTISSINTINNDNLYNVNKEINSIEFSKIGTFDIIIFSLVSFYNNINDLEKIWLKIDELCVKSSKIICVDLHPSSKFEDFPWRKNIVRNTTYWGMQLQKSILFNEYTNISFEYYHHTLESLFNNPIKLGFRLNFIHEFPEKLEDIMLKSPAYLFSVWEKC